MCYDNTHILTVQLLRLCSAESRTLNHQDRHVQLSISFMCDGYGGQCGQYPWYAQTKPFPIPKRHPSCEHQGKHNIHVYRLYMYNIIYMCKWSHLFHAVHCLPSRLLPVGDAMIHRSRSDYFSRYKTINYKIKKIRWHIKFNKSSKMRGMSLL